MTPKKSICSEIIELFPAFYVSKYKTNKNKCYFCHNLYIKQIKFTFISGSKYGTSYPLGIHRFTFTGLMCNLYLRIIVPSTIPTKTVHSKAVGTSQYNESDFAQLSQMPQCTNGTPPALFIGESL